MPIAKITKGTSPEVCLHYTLGKPDAALLDTNCESSTPQGLATEFELAISLQRRTRSRTTTNVVFHSSIGAPVGVQLSPDQWQAIARYYIKGMGFDPRHHQYVVVRHNDRDHDHVHIVVNRVSLEGRTPNDWQDWKRAETLMREIEAKFNLPAVASSEQSLVKAPTVGEIRRARQTGQPIPRVVMQQAIEECAPQCRSLTELQTRLRPLGVEMTMAPLNDDPQYVKLFFQYGKSTYSASGLGKRYTQKGLREHFEIHHVQPPRLIKRADQQDNASYGDDEPVPPPMPSPATAIADLAPSSFPLPTSAPVNPLATTEGELLNSLAGVLQTVLKDLDQLIQQRAQLGQQRVIQRTVNTVFAQAWHQSRTKSRDTLIEPSPTSGDRLYSQWLWDMISQPLLEAGNPPGELDARVAHYALSQGYKPTTVIRVVSQSPTSQSLYQTRGLEAAQRHIQQVMRRVLAERNRYRQRPAKSTRQTAIG